MKKIFICLFIAITLTSCVTKIEDLKANPKSYAGQIVAVNGRVNKLVKIPFTDYSFIELVDDSGDIVVFTLNKHKRNSEVTIKAKVVSFDSTNSEKSTKNTIKAVEDFLIENELFDKKSVKKPAKKIGDFLSKALNNLEATYFLIEETN